MWTSLIKRDAKRFARKKLQFEKQQFAGQALRELALDPSEKPTAQLIEPRLKLSGIAGALALMVIHDLHLYGGGTFAAYCISHLGLRRNAGLRRIDYARTYLELRAVCNGRREEALLRMLKEGHVRFLLKLDSPRAKLKALKLAAKAGPITGQTIHRAVCKVDPSVAPTQGSKARSARLRESLQRVQTLMDRALGELDSNAAAAAVLCEALAELNAALATGTP